MPACTRTAATTAPPRAASGPDAADLSRRPPARRPAAREPLSRPVSAACCSHAECAARASGSASAVGAVAANLPVPTPVSGAARDEVQGLRPQDDATTAQSVAQWLRCSLVAEAPPRTTVSSTVPRTAAPAAHGTSRDRPGRATSASARTTSDQLRTAAARDPVATAAAARASATASATARAARVRGARAAPGRARCRRRWCTAPRSRCRSRAALPALRRTGRPAPRAPPTRVPSATAASADAAACGGAQRASDDVGGGDGSRAAAPAPPSRRRRAAHRPRRRTRSDSSSRSVPVGAAGCRSWACTSWGPAAPVGRSSTSRWRWGRTWPASSTSGRPGRQVRGLPVLAPGRGDGRVRPTSWASPTRRCVDGSRRRLDAAGLTARSRSSTRPRSERPPPPSARAAS